MAKVDAGEYCLGADCQGRRKGPGELRIRRIRIRITAALMPVDARITSLRIMGLWPRQPSPKRFMGCSDFVCHVECLRKLLEVLVWLNKDDQALCP